MDYSAICKSTLEIALKAGDYIAGRINNLDKKDIESKGKHNFVTEVDKKSEAMIVQELELLLPRAGFIAEEGTSQKRGQKFTWVIDPLDGTTNFIHGTPPVSVSIALIEDEIPVVGVVYEVWLKELFCAWKDGPSLLNCKEIKVSKVGHLKDSLLATGFPYNNFDRLIPYMSTLVYFFNNTHGVRRLGSAAADLAYVACGRYDGFYEYNLNPWDIAAGALIVTQAGGKVSDFKGSNNYLFGKEIVASNARLFNEFQQEVDRLMDSNNRPIYE